jgi:type I restriction enzyme S subunit
MPEIITGNMGTNVAFGDVVQLSKVRSKDPEADGFERYVGLEHLEPGDLKIRSWGDITDGTTFTNVFQPGQVLFGKRRAYQRKVAVADFSGVCSGDIYVLEPKHEQLLPELLPFICQTDAFFDHAVGTSAGSLSPRTNWKSLATFEFALPPLEEQRRIAEVLWAFQKTEENIRTALVLLEVVEESAFRSLLSGIGITTTDNIQHEIFGLIPASWPLKSISSVADVAYGISAAVAENKDPSIGWPILTGANITLEGTLDLSNVVYHTEPTKPSFILKHGDVLLNWRSGSKAHVGKAAIFELEGNWTFASFILRIRASEDLRVPYLWRLLNFMRKHELFSRSTTQQVNFKMNAAFFREVAILVPPIRIQDEIIENMRPIWAARADFDVHLQRLGVMRQAFLPGLGVGI